MKRFPAILTLALLLLGLASCTGRPKGVLSTRKMTSVLVEMHLTEAALQEKGYNYGHEREVQLCYQAALEKEGVTQAEFDSSLVWYTDHPTHFNRVYARVVADLERKGAPYRGVRYVYLRGVPPVLEQKWEQMSSSHDLAVWPPEEEESPANDSIYIFGEEKNEEK